MHKVSQVGAEQARIELQVVILEWLGTAVILADHLAQVSQVDQAQQVSVEDLPVTQRGHQGCQEGQMTRLALKEASFPFRTLCTSAGTMGCQRAPLVEAAEDVVEHGGQKDTE